MKSKPIFKKIGSIIHSNYCYCYYTKYWFGSLLTAVLLLSGSVLLAQKPTVSIVVWDEKSIEGHNRVK